MKATVDKDGCIACGICVNLCPDVFRWDDNGLAEAYSDISPATESAAVDSRSNCPVSVISIEDA